MNWKRIEQQFMVKLRMRFGEWEENRTSQRVLVQWRVKVGSGKGT